MASPLSSTERIRGPMSSQISATSAAPTAHADGRLRAQRVAQVGVVIKDGQLWTPRQPDRNRDVNKICTTLTHAASHPCGCPTGVTAQSQDATTAHPATTGEQTIHAAVRLGRHYTRPSPWTRRAAQPSAAPVVRRRRRRPASHIAAPFAPPASDVHHS